jgi:hypothetical protein
MSKIFKKETELCAAFLGEVAKLDRDWIAYPETEGFDIVLVRKCDQVQIGIEAKLALNAKVLLPSLDGARGWSMGVVGPDYRAVLVPSDAAGHEIGALCCALGITVIRCHSPTAQKEEWRRGVWRPAFSPDLPDEVRGWDVGKTWHQWCPDRRLKLPDYVPDVTAGASSPLALTEWKIKAIKLAILLEDRPVTRSDFKALQLSPTRWTDPFTGWLVKAENGYIAGPNLPNFQQMHPTAYPQIKADKDKWAPSLRPKAGSLI